MANYPPGVTGRERTIAGPEWSGDVAVECGKPCTIAMTPHGFPALLVQDVDLDECPFEGEVEVERHGGVQTWTCPVCGHEHQDDLPEGDDDHDHRSDR